MQIASTGATSNAKVPQIMRYPFTDLFCIVWIISCASSWARLECTLFEFHFPYPPWRHWSPPCQFRTTLQWSEHQLSLSVPVGFTSYGMSSKTEFTWIPQFVHEHKSLTFTRQMPQIGKNRPTVCCFRIAARLQGIFWGWQEIGFVRHFCHKRGPEGLITAC